MPDLETLLKAGAFLVESDHRKESNIRAVLSRRLCDYYECLGSPTNIDQDSLDSLEAVTASEALNVVEGVQRIIGAEGDTNEVPVIGTRDLAQLRTLLSIVFKWGVEPLLNRLKSSWTSGVAQPPGKTHIIDLSSLSDDFVALTSITTRLVALLFPNGPQSALPQSLITTTILNRHVGDIVAPCIILGWLPKSMSMGGTFAAVDALRPPCTRLLLSTLRPSDGIIALLPLLTTYSALGHVRRTCVYLLGRQLLRPFGVRGLLTALIGEDETNSDVELEKLEHVARVVSTVPSNLTAQEFFDDVVSQLFALLREDRFHSYCRAAAFSLSRLLNNEVASKIILTTLHEPLLVTTPESSTRTPDESLTMLLSLILNSDPSPNLISTLISPVFVPLYSLLYHLDSVKTSDPGLVESIHGALTTWGRIVGQEEGLSVLWYLLHCETPPGWRTDLEGHIKRLDSLGPTNQPSSFLTPEDRVAVEEMDETANILNLFPDPTHFVRFIKLLDRSDIASELFVKLLEAYRESKVTDGDPLKTLLYLQLVIQIQSELTQGNSPSGVLAKPSHILSFVKHALESALPTAVKSPSSATTSKPASNGLTLESLRIVDDDSLEQDQVDGDSDDEDPDDAPVAPDIEITETAINLLLSILEVHEDLSAHTEPILNDIFSVLEPLSANHPSPSTRSLARECRMVLTARLASTSSSTSRSQKSKAEEDVQATYQKALKLLQDPILPVRAHGLLLLRQLVQNSTHERPLDPALMPAILSIFLQSIQDDDSYIFLNAVQGLSGMAEVYGNEVLKNLVNVYTTGLAALASTNLTQQDVDTRIRVGEALGQVIRRCGEALGIYADMLVPPIFNVVRSRHIPTALRTSSLSLLATCESTYSLALIPYAMDLADAMLDLIQVESASNAPAQRSRNKDKDTKEVNSDSSTKPSPDVMDDQPTTTNSKLPPLRRAAIHLLSMLTRSAIKQLYTESSQGQPFPPRLIQRAKTTLSYVAFTDEDMRVRVMAREAGEYFEQLEQAAIGL
ncbi:hypothetical protein ONZ45_g477 [Pleurotus djamor]|nr:hypothetical protein ONZ45_g477 [Pleurotus djamor]